MALAGVLYFYPPGMPAGDSIFSPKYTLQILHLAPHLYLPEAMDRAAEGQPVRTSPPATSLPATTSPARQTLIVRGAPPHLRLKQPLPVPAAVSRAAGPLPAYPVQVRIDGPETPPQTPSAGKPDTPLLPPVSVVSLPDRDLVAPGVTAIPAVNQVAAAANSRPESPSPQNGPSRAGLSSQAGAPSRDASQSQQGSASEVSPSAADTPARQASTPHDRPSDASLTRIEQARDGRPQTSLFGESVAGQIPEAADQMRGLAVSTIYIRLGLKKSWILEYWLPPDGKTAVPKGHAPGLEAPWPYLMFRPDLALPPGADAVLVRGSLTAEGELEHLALLLPAEWTQKDALFQALQQWKFRPALRNGQAQGIEVLLVIPRQMEQ